MLKLLFRLFLVLVAGILLTAGYLGLIPGLSSVMGADKPKDLGITYTEQDFQSILTKSGISQKTLPETSDVLQSAHYEGQHELTTSFTGQDLTALINASGWKYNHFSNVQIKFNSDGTTEISGNVNLDKLWTYVGMNGVSQGDIAKAQQALSVIPSSPAFYAKGVVEAENNQVTNLNLDNLTIGRLSVPQSIIQPNQHYLGEMAEKEMNSISGFYVKSAKVENGQAAFEGTVPDVESIVKSE